MNLNKDTKAGMLNVKLIIKNRKTNAETQGRRDNKKL